MLKAVILDLDETLINSKEVILRFFRELFSEMGLPFPEGREEILFTGTEKGIFHKLVTDPEKRRQAARFRERFGSVDQIRAMSLKPHARETLDALYGRYKLAMATNRGETTGPVLRHFDLERYFEIVIHARSLSEAKPHPIVVETILKHLGLSAREAVLVGDSMIDVETARNGGVPCVIVGRHAAEGIGDYRLDDLSGLPGLLLRLDRRG